MVGQFSLRNVLYERTIYIRMTGRFDSSLMRSFAAEYTRATDEYEGQRHLVLADMRDMAPLLPEISQIFESAIRYGRARGVLCCAHLANDATQKWQAARLARQASPAADVTLNFVTIEEAQAALEQFRQQMRRTSRPPPPASGTVPTVSTISSTAALGNLPLSKRIPRS